MFSPRAYGGKADTEQIHCKIIVDVDNTIVRIDCSESTEYHNLEK